MTDTTSATDADDPALDTDQSVHAAWALLGIPGAVTAATYLAVANAKQFRLVVDTLADEQRHRLTGVSREELPALLHARLADRVSAGRASALLSEEAFPLDARLRQLVKWGTCEQWQDDAASDEDFLRNRERYQLTEVGAAIHRLATELESTTDAATTAAVLAPPIIAEQLDIALASLAAGEVEATVNALTLVQTTLADMARTAAIWQSRLAAAIGGAPDPQKIGRLRQTVTDYVDMWGSGVDLHSERIAARAERLLALDSQAWRTLAFHRVSASSDDAVVAAVVDEMVDTVTTLLGWFDGPQAQARRLRRQIRDAVAPLVRGHRTLLAVGGAVSRRADLIRLAGALDAASCDADAWRVWCTTTGLYAPRHLSLLAPEVADPTHTSFWDAPPVPIERRLRTHGARALAGRAARITDTSAQRAAAKAREAAVRARTAAAEHALASRSGLLLSQWEELGEAEAELLLDFLAAARGGYPDAHGVRHAVSSDGRWRISLRPATPARSALIRMPHGRLVVADAIVEISR